MTEMHVPAHITLTRRIAQQEAAAVTALAVTEQQLRTQLDEHQRDAAAERDRIEAELRAAREKAEKHLEALAETGRRLTSELTGVGRQLQRHHDEATEAQHTVLAWCTRAGISPDDLPPLRDTGPLPAIAAPTAPEMPDRCDECETTGRNCTAHGGRPGIPYTPPAEPKLPSLEVSDAVLEAGRRAADPGATRVDAGGDQPAEGPFPGGVESPAGPRPKRARRRPQSDRVNEQDGDA
jgi:hypothetical protein